MQAKLSGKEGAAQSIISYPFLNPIIELHLMKIRFEANANRAIPGTLTGMRGLTRPCVIGYGSDWIS